MTNNIFEELLKSTGDKERWLLEISELRQQVENLNSKIENIADTITALKNAHNRLNGKVERLQKRVYGPLLTELP